MMMMIMMVMTTTTTSLFLSKQIYALYNCWTTYYYNSHILWQVPLSNPKERKAVKLGEFVETSPPREKSPDQPLAITQGEEEPVGENNNTQANSDKYSKQDDKKDEENKGEESKPKVERSFSQLHCDNKVKWYNMMFSI